MTREEIMANRILPKEVIQTVREEYADDHLPDFRDIESWEDAEKQMYISPEKVQRMSPEAIADSLLASGKYKPGDTEGIMRVLSLATGRTEQELREAVFGTGSFDAMRFYQPTPLQKRAIKTIERAILYINESGKRSGYNNLSAWPEPLRKEWKEICGQIPRRSRRRVF